MTKKGLEEYAIIRLNEKPAVYNYLLKRVYKELNTSYLYKNQCYCSLCRNYFDYDSSKCEKGICPTCRRKINLIKLKNVRSVRDIKYLFSLIDLDKKNNILICKLFCIEERFCFNSGKMSVYSDLFTISSECYDLTNGHEKIVYKNAFLSNYGCYSIFNFGSSARIHNSLLPLSGKNFYVHKNEESFFINDVFITNCLKEKFLKYISLEMLRIHFGCSCDVIPFVRALAIYPKLETLFKLERNCFCKYDCDFYESVVKCLKKPGKKYQYYDFDYHLMKDVYTLKEQWIDFSYYIVNVILGKPYIVNKQMIIYLSCHLKLITREKVNYLLKHLNDNEFSLYSDYIYMCKALGYSLKDKKILYPSNLAQKHDEYSLMLSEIIDVKQSEEYFVKKENYKLLEFSESGFRFYLPISDSEFKTRGNLLKQCLFSSNFHKRYIKGKSIIVFVDGSGGLSTRFTLELNTNLNIVQLHGFANDINCSYAQKNNLDIVRKIILKRLSLLEIKKGQIVFKNVEKKDMIMPVKKAIYDVVENKI